MSTRVESDVQETQTHPSSVKHHIYSRAGVWFVCLRRRDAEGNWHKHRGVIAGRNSIDAALAVVAERVAVTRYHVNAERHG